MLDDAMFEGTGGAQPLGFMNAGCKVSHLQGDRPGRASPSSRRTSTRCGRAAPARMMADAEWWINQDCFPQLNALSMVIGTGGVPVYLPPGGLSARPTAR
jgi:hypothetical protein